VTNSMGRDRVKAAARKGKGNEKGKGKKEGRLK
jgi:hypothetical protein